MIGLRAAWARKLLLVFWLPAGLMLGSAVFPALLLVLPGAWAAAASAASGLAAAYLLLRYAVLSHEEGHIAEARRLGFSASLRSSTWNSWRWATRGLRLQFGRRADGAEPSEDDKSLIGIEGAWASQLAYEASLKRYSNLHLIFPMLLAGCYSYFGTKAPGWIRGASGLLAAAAGGVWAVRQAHRAVAWVSQPEFWERPAGRTRDFQMWPFWKHLRQRAVERNPKLLQRDFRLIMRSAAGVRGAHVVLELGAGASPLWTLVPRPMRRGWIFVDADSAVIHYCRTRGLGTRWLYADARRLPVQDDGVDRIVGLAFFDAVYSAQLDSILIEAYRVLRPGGLLVHLQDFPDWPGPQLKEDFNALLKDAGLHAAVGYDKKRNQLTYPAVKSEVAARIRAALRGLAVPTNYARAQLRFLTQVFSRCGGPRLDQSNPRLAFLRIFVASLERHGFEVLSNGSDLSARLRYTSFLVARKPKRAVPPPRQGEAPPLAEGHC